MNVFEKLAKSAENNHGLELQALQVKELVTAMQAMQMQIANDQGRLEAATRILTQTVLRLGGELTVPQSDFIEAQEFVVEVEWNEEGDINVATRLADVAVPEVSGEDEAAGGSAGSPVSVLADGGGQPEDGEENPDEEG